MNEEKHQVLEAQRAREEVRRILHEEDNFLIASHYNPDGDALGSIAALGFLCRELGKTFMLYNTTGAPERFHWLTLPGKLATSLADLDGFSPDWYIVLDCGDPKRAGSELFEALPAERTVNIDHHLSNPNFGKVNWVDTKKAAVGEMIAELAHEFDVELTGGLGEAIYLAVVTDTGNFSYANTTAATMELGAEIVRLGLDPSKFTDKLENQWTMQKLGLWRELLQGLRFHCGGGIGVIKAPSATLAATGTTIEDCEGLVEFVRQVRDVKVAVMMRDYPDGPQAGRVKFSLRSKGATNVQAIAGHFGGGGHKNAAGGQMDGPLERAEMELVRVIADELGIADQCAGACSCDD